MPPPHTRRSMPDFVPDPTLGRAAAVQTRPVWLFASGDGSHCFAKMRSAQQIHQCCKADHPPRQHRGRTAKVDFPSTRKAVQLHPASAVAEPGRSSQKGLDALPAGAGFDGQSSRTQQCWPCGSAAQACRHGRSYGSMIDLAETIAEEGKKKGTGTKSAKL